MFNLRLPTIEMVAGDTCPFIFNLQDITQANIFTNRCTAYFSISSYINETDSPLWQTSKILETIDEDGDLIFEPAAKDTVDLRGKYVYQLHLSNDTHSEIYNGFLIVHPNRNKTVIS